MKFINLVSNKVKWQRCWIFIFGAGVGKNDPFATEIDLEASSSSKVAPRKQKYGMSSIKLFGVDLSPDNVAVAMVYFVQGVLGLARLAVNFYLKDDLHLDPAEVCLLNLWFNMLSVHIFFINFI